MGQGDGSLYASEEIGEICHHPTEHIHYYSEYDEFDDCYEEYWCDLCNCWIPSGFMEEIKMRPDWNGGLTK